MPKKEEKPKISSGTIAVISIAIIIVIFGGIFYAIRIYKPAPKTIDQILHDNLKAKPTAYNYVYNNYSFVRLSDQFWHTQARDVYNSSVVFDMTFNYGPKEVGNISISGTPYLGFLNDPVVFMTFDPTSPPEELPTMAVSMQELSFGLARVYGKTLQAACTNNQSDACNGRPIVDCSNDASTILLNVSNQTGIQWYGKCVVISGSKQEMVMTAERFLYKLYNIVQ